MNAHKLQIIPGPDGIATQGTKVLLDGVEVKGLRKIELSAEANDVWRATLHLMPEMIEVTTLANVACTFGVIGQGLTEPDRPAREYTAYDGASGSVDRLGS
ncbi:MAG: hypothetical protein DI587_31385 [Variovorax paradoxus]|nr:MAG: hypothetical protein DI583_31385 [Variovorax paradoxus]PZQ03164.1 MAG: hypothetical protein DI587_31385 [Variovorax paradoxus]